MQLHDWTRVGDETFHAFHLRWITHLSDALNGGILPQDYYADPEPSHKGLRRTLTIRHTSRHRIVSLVEILAPGNKAGADAVRGFVWKAVEAIRAGVHLVVIDLLPPGQHDPQGIASEIHEALFGKKPLPKGKPLTFISYSAGATPESYLLDLAVGDEVPDWHLFLTAVRYANLRLGSTYATEILMGAVEVASECYVNLPLGSTYATTYGGVPEFWREVIEGKREAPDAS